MNHSIAKKFTIALTLLASLGLFSCGGGGGGDDTEFEFKSSDLMNKYWYANPYLSSDYNRDDALLVYRFDGGGVLKRQEFSGRRDEVVGQWSLINSNELVIEDHSISADNRQEWFIQNSSTSSYIKLNSSNGTREFYTSMDDLGDVSADAYVVNDVHLVNNAYQSDYRMEYVVYGDQISQVKVLPNESTSIELQDFTDYQGHKVYYLKESDRMDYFSDFSGNTTTKFNLKVNGENYKLEDQIYDSAIAALDHFSITATHASQSGTVTINWKAINEDHVYYYVEILDKNANQYAPKFRSTRQPAIAGEAKELVIDSGIASEYEALSELEVGQDYYVKIIGFKYEDGIDPDNSSNKEMNIQAVTQYIFKGGTW